MMERLLEEVSLSATECTGETIAINAACVRDQVADLANGADLSRFIL